MQERNAARALLVVLLAALCGVTFTAARASGTSAAATRPEDEGFPAEGLIGVVYPVRALDLHVEISGRVDTIAVALGRRVEQGALLIRLDDRWLRHDLEAARADEAAATAELEMAIIERDWAERRRSRREQAPDSWSTEELGEISYQAELAVAKVARAEANLQRRRALVANLAERVARTTLTAPFAGTITRRYVEPGFLVDQGDPLLRLISDRDLGVRFGVPEELVGSLAPGAVLEAHLPLVDLRADLTLTRIAPEIDPATGLATAEGVLRVPAALEGHILAGMSVRIAPAHPVSVSP